MPSVISDTSPLQYLHQIGCLGLLADLFQRVIVPAGVAQEIQRGAQQGVDLPDLRQLAWVMIQTTSAPRTVASLPNWATASARFCAGPCKLRVLSCFWTTPKPVNKRRRLAFVSRGR